MKTSVIEVRDMLSVLSVQGVEERIGDVPGVQSATVNFAAASATVRYDETRLTIADIRSAVRQSGYASDVPADAPADDGHEAHTASGAPPPPDASSSPKTSQGATVPAGTSPSAPKPSTGVSATAPAAEPAALKSTPDAAHKGDEAALAKS